MRWLGRLRMPGGSIRAGLGRGWRWLLGHTGPHVGRLLVLARRSVVEFRDDNCLQLAGSIAYHVLLSILPLIIVVVSIFGLLLDSGTIRETIVRTVQTYVPLTGAGQDSLTRLLSRLQGAPSAVGLFGLVGVFLAASGMMGTIRTALNLAWDTGSTRPLVRGKAMDMVLALAAGAVLSVSAGLTVAFRLARQTGQAGGWLSFLGPLVGVVEILLPMLLSFGVFTLLYTVVPAGHAPFREVWPGALTGAVLFQILKEAFAAYLGHFGHYNVLYGALGAGAAFIFFVYLSAIVMLLGAEVASEYPRLPRSPASRTARP